MVAKIFLKGRKSSKAMLATEWRKYELAIPLGAQLRLFPALKCGVVSGALGARAMFGREFVFPLF